MFTDDEADLVQHLPIFRPRTAEKVARKAGRGVEEVRATLDHLAFKKAVVLAYGSPRKYTILPILPGTFEMALMTPDLSTRNVWHQRFAEIFERIWESGFMGHYKLSSKPPVRYLPVGKVADTLHKAWPSDHLESILDHYDLFAVGNCQCRMAMDLAGKGCGKPLLACTTFGPSAKPMIERGLMKPVDRQEILAIKRNAEEHGCVTWMMNATGDPRGDGSCSCCGCCCHALRGVTEFNVPGLISRPHFMPEKNAALCNLCGKCVRICPMGAWTLGEKEVTFTPSRCIGCGLCVVACKTGAFVAAARGRRPPAGAKLCFAHAQDDARVRGQHRGRVRAPAAFPGRPFPLAAFCNRSQNHGRLAKPAGIRRYRGCGLGHERKPARRALAHGGRGPGPATGPGRGVSQISGKPFSACRSQPSGHGLAGCFRGRHRICVRIPGRGEPPLCSAGRDGPGQRLCAGVSRIIPGAGHQFPFRSSLLLENTAPCDRGCAWVLRRALGIGGAEGLSAAANVFVGMVEAPLFIRPYVSRLSRAELFCVMTCGMATIAGTVMVIYATFLENVIPLAMGHLLVASVISAPAAIALARLLVPAKEKDLVDAQNPEMAPAGSSMEAIANGAQAGMQIFISIVAMLVVLVALVKLVNIGLDILPDVAGGPLTLERFLGWLMAPVVWLIGVPARECATAGSLMGIKTVLNELLAYLQIVPPASRHPFRP